MSKYPDAFDRIAGILALARSGIARTVNTTQVVANWLVGRELFEEEQQGRRKARYGDDLLRTIAGRLQAALGGGCSHTNLKLFRQFYREYPHLLDGIMHSRESCFADLALTSSAWLRKPRSPAVWPAGLICVILSDCAAGWSDIGSE